MMTTAQTGRATRIPAADGRAAMTDSRNSRMSLGHRLGLRLWTLLHAQALINGGGNAVRYGPP
jgi:hypothetical protein